MKLKKVLSLLLALVMTASLLTLPAHAEDAGAEETSTTAATVNFTNVAPLVKADSTSAANAIRKAPLLTANLADDEGNDGTDTDTDPDNGMKISKTAEKNADGSYTIKLEAYATGSKIISEITKDVPTDIILVLDQSGSMSENMTSYTYNEVYSLNHNQTYYVQQNGSYVPVTWCRDCRAWTNGCSDLLWWHSPGTSYTPKKNEADNATGHVQFYKQGSATTTTRLDALKTAVTNFANAVKEKSAGADGIAGNNDDVDHRIAVVGFAGDEENYNLRNSEVFIGSTQYTYGLPAQGQYKNAFQSMKTEEGYQNVLASKEALDASGGTFINLGLEMANGIFEANPIEPNEKRNRVVIVFTDGIPGMYTNRFDDGVASDAISQANTAKNTYGATVYSIGIFSGADAASAGNKNGTNTQKANWFMQTLSSNNGTPQDPSYYLSAADSDALSTIFKNISDQIETGGSSSTLTDESIVKDIISPQFTLPEGASADSITLETYAYGGKNNATGNDIWTKNATAMGAKATISSTDESKEITKDNQVSVTGFNFSDNWCGMVKNADGSEIPRGNKLVISFKVEPRDKFLGGNGVNTNTDAGIYKDKDAKDPILKFEKPNVDVDIKEPTITAPDANVYLGAYFEDTIPADELKKGTSISFDGGKITLDMTKPNENWGLEDWQTEYVNISVTVKDKDGTEVTDFKNLKEDTDYTVSISITPKKPKTDNNGFQEDAKGTIHVFTPELTFQDSTAYYGEAVSNNYDTANKVAEKWTHDGKYSTDEGVQMLGNKPTLNLNYTPDSTKITADNKYGKKDVPVSVTVKIGNEDVTVYTTFVHQACAPDCGWTTPNPANGDPAFLVHIKTCTLNITKAGGADDESYVFDVYKDSVKYSEVTVWGNGTETLVELPVGTYTIVEDSNWSWRYPNPTYSAENVDLSSTTPIGAITCTNAKATNSWLNGFSAVVRNIFSFGKN